MSGNKLETSFAAVNGDIDYGILTGISPIYRFENGKRVGDSPIGKRVNVALQGNRLSPLSVKIETSSNLLPGLTEERIAESCASLKLLAVRFTDCKIALYSIGGQMVMSATASGAELVTFGK